MALHNHLLVNGTTLTPPTDQKKLESWLKQLVVDIDMKITMGPHSFYVDKVGNKGLTAIVGIETSHIAVHVWDEPNPSLIQFDLYTCSHLPTQAVLKNLEDELGLENYKYMVIEREHKFNILENK